MVDVVVAVMRPPSSAAPEEEAALERGATPAQTQEALREAGRGRRFFWNRCRTRCFTSAVADCGQEKGETGSGGHATIWWEELFSPSGGRKTCFSTGLLDWWVFSMTCS